MTTPITIIPNLTEVEQQFDQVNSLIEQHRSSAIAKVNMEALLTNWCNCQLHNWMLTVGMN